MSSFTVCGFYAVLYFRWSIRSAATASHNAAQYGSRAGSLQLGRACLTTANV